MRTAEQTSKQSGATAVVIAAVLFLLQGPWAGVAVAAPATAPDDD